MTTLQGGYTARSRIGVKINPVPKMMVGCARSRDLPGLVTTSLEPPVRGDDLLLVRRAVLARNATRGREDAASNHSYHGRTKSRVPLANHNEPDWPTVKKLISFGLPVENVAGCGRKGNEPDPDDQSSL